MNIRKFIKNIILTKEEQTILLDFDSLLEDYKESSSSLESMSQTNELLNMKLKDTFDKYTGIQEKYSELLSSGVVDVGNLRSWYEGRRNQSPWIFNGGRLGNSDVKNYLKVKGDEGETIMKNAAEEVIFRYKLTGETSLYLIVESLLKYFSLQGNWTYAFDIDNYKVSEFWQEAHLSWLSRKGDCDDLAILMHVLFNYILASLKREEESWRLTFTAGFMNVGGGHAFNTFLHTDGEYYVVESTFDVKGSYSRAWLHTPVRYDNTYYNFWGFATKEKSWVGSMSALINYNELKGIE